jgi:redox-sensitive bicupin YhaK (pirin superfamily)
MVKKALQVYPPDMQAEGEFDYGKIVEQKPIGFPGEGSEVKRVGPLFYWSWFQTKGEGKIGLHPHKGFEIMTYVISGQVSHGDTLGTQSKVGAGGAQVMQTGSGVSHEEGFEGAEGFQIWFEPNLNEAFKRQPTYHQFEHEDFSIAEVQDTKVKTILGEESRIQLVADVSMWDIEIGAGKVYEHRIPAGYSAACLVTEGGALTASVGMETIVAQPRDFIVSDSPIDAFLKLQASDSDRSRLFILIVPTQVEYPLYPL